ncbi:hypothetical protein NGA_0443000, partial [Nannochloropsis gaditana CCMP526]|uniref:uncharacterized protein n=1 Tax=Nannochloropsis gaditana (strain CCMP526) TaxID=1093141 RepID=UPI00029F6D2B
LYIYYIVATLSEAIACQARVWPAPLLPSSISDGVGFVTFLLSFRLRSSILSWPGAPAGFADDVILQAACVGSAEK